MHIITAAVGSHFCGNSKELVSLDHSQGKHRVVEDVDGSDWFFNR